MSVTKMSVTKEMMVVVVVARRGEGDDETVSVNKNTGGAIYIEKNRLARLRRGLAHSERSEQ